MPSSIVTVSCLLSSAVHGLLVPATRPGMVTSCGLARVAAPEMKASLGRRVLLLAPLAPLLAAPARAFAVAPTYAEKMKAEREKVAKDRAALQKKGQTRVKKEVGTKTKANPDKARKQLASIKKSNDKDVKKFNQQRLAKQKEDAKIARIRSDKKRRAQGKKVSKGGGVGPLTLLLVGGVGLAGVVLLGDDEGPTEVTSWYDAGKRLV